MVPTIDLASMASHADKEGNRRMQINGLEIQSGTWLSANCGKFPSEKNCRLVLMAPESQREDLINAAAAHAVANHGHQDTPELRSELNKFLDPVQV
jgi:hypothetical protein